MVAERRDKALDSALLASWRNLQERGASHLRPIVESKLPRREREHLAAGLVVLPKSKAGTRYAAPDLCPEYRHEAPGRQG
jgi:hypothetical protein